MKYPFLLLLGMVMFSTLIFMMLMSAVVTELEVVFEKKHDPELDTAD